nr:S4 domain-containing protein [Barrientosiimonas endolithica]
MGEGSSRVDQALVTRGLARSRALARAYVDAGRVRRDGVVVAKASERVGPDDVLELEGEQERWVGRAAYKLVGAFDAFGPRGLSATGRRCLDVGASTGGSPRCCWSGARGR